MLADQQELGIVLGITLPIAVLLCVVGSILFCCGKSEYKLVVPKVCRETCGGTK